MTRTDPATGIRTAPKREVLISGASIAGPVLAFWLSRYGYAVTVVEKSGTLRSGGYPIDVRGTALEVVRKMGILPRLRDAHVDLRRLTFLDGDGAEVVSLNPHTVTGGVAGRDLEVRRGDLTEALYGAVRDDVEFMFGDSIETLDQSDHGVDVTFRRGGSRTFDMVFGADGMHSHTREMLFGHEKQFHRYLGYCFAVFTMPNTFGLSHETVMWNTPGRAAALYAVGDSDEVHAFLNFAQPEPPFDAFTNPEAQRDLVATVFADAGWEVPGMLAAMREADDLFFDGVGQIRMPRWSSGRGALVGDAAYAPSFLTGQGTSIALVGAYMLAGSLAARDHAAGFAAYEHATRDFVTMNQDLVGKGSATLFPTTAQALEERNSRLRDLSTMPSAEPRPAHSALTLPDFEPAP
ncbi:FAD-dependent monooxygenase [Actinomadura madurae]|uniref:FAD-dependent monooxygenase n=1 Tax=Actinomadura madurae TaxID=1993 RepID=UPI0020D24D3B|nr:FAD-dependent monooxygenase [Actinomadura madurae]MCP9955651.1 FAD-dependent monooxygenase [Actinomadura madurae]MCP9972384.1 FAD-dependent monooxygenase [Actinomadura madurae]MCP9984897.1 FAD-dependent monooxygenase [Actinomadura madurae]MCQ0003552.1 FAD-dependent monooxygenase [Actinomadura madurae]MCQ0021087.1 FAD-dependent monooxygenase [Actinomadura madurae]